MSPPRPARLADAQAVVAHHVTISVRDLDSTVAFYSELGWQLVLRWDDPDGSLRIAHLALADGQLLEVFAYAANTALPPPAPLGVGNDLETVGVKHFGVRVDDLEKARGRLVDKWPDRVTPIRRGRTGIDYFFVCDPDGLWVEVVHDTRALDPNHPTLLS
jgi:glyoxylase I family protein